MRKFLATVVFLILILFAPYTLASTYAQENVEITSPPATPSNEYILPYPGMLPDNPLYKLKVLRDKIYDFFIKDPIKKAQFKLLMADKRMNMARMLSDQKGNNSLASDTIVDAVSYYSGAVNIFLSVNPHEISTDGLGPRLKETGKAYLPIIADYIQTFESVDAEKLSDAYNTVVSNYQKLPK
ncbi:hypothetical protein HYT02_03610 [Candidatus Gottesmanbacteria bacterium]|nr:hypothetical protein [Candidatus Gottesmanbacteria bacterium]